MNDQPIRHTIVNQPSVQAQLMLYDFGPYSSVQMAEDNSFYYIVGKKGINAISFPDSPFRSVWSQDIADVLVKDLNTKFSSDAVDTNTKE